VLKRRHRANQPPRVVKAGRRSRDFTEFLYTAIWSDAHASLDKNQVVVILKGIALGLSLTAYAALEFFQNQFDEPRLVTVQPSHSCNLIIGQHCCLIEVKDFAVVSSFIYRAC